MKANSQDAGLSVWQHVGGRAQEAADARDGWFDFANRTVSIIGKGQRERITPPWPSTVRLLKLYRDDHCHVPGIRTPYGPT